MWLESRKAPRKTSTAGRWMPLEMIFLTGMISFPWTNPAPKNTSLGKMYDTTTNLYYFHARWYDPVVGRFVSRDKVENALRFKGYDFVYNNPIIFADPTGRQTIGPTPPPDGDGEPIPVPGPKPPQRECSQGTVPIWRCKRQLGRNPLVPRIGFVSHSYICCGGVNQNCFGVPADLQGGREVPPEDHPTGQCMRYCVCPEQKRSCCENPQYGEFNYDPLLHNCHDWSRSCVGLSNRQDINPDDGYFILGPIDPPREL